jgi:hypothetical protein
MAPRRMLLPSPVPTYEDNIWLKTILERPTHLNEMSFLNSLEREGLVNACPESIDCVNTQQPEDCNELNRVRFCDPVSIMGRRGKHIGGRHHSPSGKDSREDEDNVIGWRVESTMVSLSLNGVN